MKKLGLVGGMGAESTIPYYHDIVYGVQNKVGLLGTRSGYLAFPIDAFYTECEIIGLDIVVNALENNRKKAKII